MLTALALAATMGGAFLHPEPSPPPELPAAVHQAQEDIFAAIKPGVSMADLQHVAEESMRRAGDLADFIDGFGHFVGLDVHDAGDLDKPIPVEAVFTVEPGIYLPAQGFGVRIEDEVLMTATGYRLLTR